MFVQQIRVNMSSSTVWIAGKALAQEAKISWLVFWSRHFLLCCNKQSAMLPQTWIRNICLFYCVYSKLLRKEISLSFDCYWKGYLFCCRSTHLLKNIFVILRSIPFKRIWIICGLSCIFCVLMLITVYYFAQVSSTVIEIFP